MIRRALTRLLLVVLIVFCGYNWLQVRVLQAQVVDMQKALALQEGRVTALPTQPPLPALLTQASRHAGLARIALAQSDWKTARRELQQGIGEMNKAAQSPDARHDLTALQTQTQQLQEEARALWRKVNSQSQERLLP